MVLVDFPPDQFTGTDQKEKLFFFFFFNVCSRQFPHRRVRTQQRSSTYLQVCVEDPDEGADRWIHAGFEDHKPSWTVFSPDAAVSRGRRLQTQIAAAALLNVWKCALT